MFVLTGRKLMSGAVVVLIPDKVQRHGVNNIIFTKLAKTHLKETDEKGRSVHVDVVGCKSLPQLSRYFLHFG